LDSRFHGCDGSFGERAGADFVDMIVARRRIVNVLFFALKDAAAPILAIGIYSQAFFL
jgi:hypothetical protein